MTIWYVKRNAGAIVAAHEVPPANGEANEPLDDAISVELQTYLAATRRVPTPSEQADALSLRDPFVRGLIKALAEYSQAPQSMTPAQWRNRIKALAD